MICYELLPLAWWIIRDYLSMSYFRNFKFRLFGFWVIFDYRIFICRWKFRLFKIIWAQCTSQCLDSGPMKFDGQRRVRADGWPGSTFPQAQTAPGTGSSVGTSKPTRLSCIGPGLTTWQPIPNLARRAVWAQWEALGTDTDSEAAAKAGKWAMALTPGLQRQVSGRTRSLGPSSRMAVADRLGQALMGPLNAGPGLCAQPNTLWFLTISCKQDASFFKLPLAQHWIIGPCRYGVGYWHMLPGRGWSSKGLTLSPSPLPASGHLSLDLHCRSSKPNVQVSPDPRPKVPVTEALWAWGPMSWDTTAGILRRWHGCCIWKLAPMNCSMIPTQYLPLGVWHCLGPQKAFQGYCPLWAPMVGFSASLYIVAVLRRFLVASTGSYTLQVLRVASQSVQANLCMTTQNNSKSSENLNVPNIWQNIITHALNKALLNWHTL